MDVPASAAGPWIALGAVLGILLLLAVAAVALSLRRAPDRSLPATPTPPARDDLPGFLEHPPGTPGAAEPGGDGWAALSPALPAPPTGTAPPPAVVDRTGPVLAGITVLALLLVGTAAAIAASARDPESSTGSAATPSAAAASGGTSAASAPSVAARLSFGGVVLEEHAVGISAAYPELELTSDGDDAVAHLRLPTANCLATTAPAPPGDPACRSTPTEYADLSAPDLRVIRDGEVLHIDGSFAGYVRRPDGSAQSTGRSYRLTVTVRPTGDVRSGWRPAEAELSWGDQRVGSRVDGEPSVVRFDD